MHIKLLKIVVWLILVFFTSCTKPKIPISNTLEGTLGDRYSYYLKVLNRSAEGDSNAIVEFLLIKDIYDGASYDHGDVLIELMKIIGDCQFSNALLKLNEDQLEQVRTYFNAGSDVNSEIKELFIQYPITFKILRYSDSPGVPFK